MTQENKPTNPIEFVKSHPANPTATEAKKGENIRRIDGVGGSLTQVNPEIAETFKKVRDERKLAQQQK